MGVERACIIGAGSSGIVAAKIFRERGIPFDCYEKGSGIGGNWRYHNNNGMSSIYQSLHINTSRDRMAYADFPMPGHYPDFPHHTQVLAYFEDYVDHFGIREAITLGVEVVHVAPVSDGAYEVTVRSVGQGETNTRRYGAVLVANGHHWDPNWPDVPGLFDGHVLHSHQYTKPDVLDGKRVLIVGVGNSACDIASEATSVARHTILSTRRGAHVVPKYLLGRPLDTFTTPLTSRLPSRLQRLIAQTLLFLARGKQAGYGFPTPDYPFGSEHPTISSDLLNLIGHGKIDVRPDLEYLAGDRAHFVDGTETAVDVVLFATGYNVTFPFFDKDFLRAEANRLSAYLHVVPPEHPNLYFIGLIQPLGAVMPLAEAQCEWVADLLEGQASLPPRSTMWAAIQKQDAKIAQRYVPSKRHTIQVDFYPYQRAVERERKRGRKRAPNQALPPAEDMPPEPVTKHIAPRNKDLKLPPRKDRPARTGYGLSG